MGKFLAKLISGSVLAAAFLAVGVPSWAQTDSLSSGFCLPDQYCPNPAYANCVSRAGEDKQALCECACKFAGIKEMSSKECLTDVCGVSQGGIGSKISLGPVFHGVVFDDIDTSALVKATDSCTDFLATEDMATTHNCVMKSFTNVTKIADSWLVHIIGILATSPTIPDPGNIVVESGSIACVQGLNQDTSSLTGCQRGLGCRELTADVNITNGCMSRNNDGTFNNIYGCCTASSTTSTACAALSGADTPAKAPPDATHTSYWDKPYDGRYGTSTKDSTGTFICP